MLNKLTSRLIPSGREPRSLGRGAPLIFWLPVIICMSAIFYFSSLPGQAIPAIFTGQDIVFHLMVYAVLGFFVSRALKHTGDNPLRIKIIMLTILFCLVYGVSDEFHQSFVPNRCMTVADVGIDVLGGFLGSLFYR